MAGRLKVDTGVLNEHGENLRVLAFEFNVADDFADYAEEAVGVHPDTEGLRHQINGFASSWRIRREEMQVDIEELKGYITHVAATFDDTEAQLAAGIEGSQQNVNFATGAVATGGGSTGTGLTPSNPGGGGGEW